MKLSTAIGLIKSGFPCRNNEATVWADLGCGSGLFTHALSHFLASGSKVYAIDKNNSLKPQTTGNGVEIIPVTSDFISDPLPEKNLDGILAANAVHYVKNKRAFLLKAGSYLKPHGSFLIVEYDTAVPVIPWVPYPETFSALQSLFRTAGFSSGQQLGTQPSVYGNRMLYAALFTRLTSGDPRKKRL